MTDLRGKIEKALRLGGGTHTYQDIVDAELAGRMQWWSGINAVLVTEVHEAPQRKTLHFFLGAGDLEEIKLLLPIPMEWGRRQGCTHASFIGRPGWARTFLAGEGWKPSKLVLFEREIPCPKVEQM